MELINFIIVLIVILVIIYIWNPTNQTNNQENFDVNMNQQYESVNYSSRKQDCSELTFNPSECVVETVIPKNKIVCNKILVLLLLILILLWMTILQENSRMKQK